MELPVQIALHPGDKICLKRPDSSELGRRIISESIYLIDELGFEQFTFRKLAVRIESTEASVYRYFENKHRLLLYLIDWYWNWIDVRLSYAIVNLDNPEEKLRRAIRLLTEKVEMDTSTMHVDEVRLQRIVIVESSKTYLTKTVDDENTEGCFGIFKDVVERVADLIKEVAPAYRYPHMLVSTVIEGAHHQRFFADHLPKLTNQHRGEDSVERFYQDLVFHAIHSDL